ncbi:MAG: hypothetical protein ABJR05_09070 [Balneola sp.]
MIYKFLIFIFLALILGISQIASSDYLFNNINKATLKNKEPKELKGTRIFKEEIALFDVNKIDSLFIFTVEQDTIFKVFDKDEEHLGSFSRVGRGPGELELVTYVPDLRWGNGSVELLIFNQQTLVATTIDLMQSIKEEKIVPSKETEFPKELRGAMPTDMYMLSDNNFIGTYDDRFYKQLDNKRGGFIYNSETENFELFELKNYTVVPNQLLPSININARSSKISPDRTKIALAHLYAPVLEVVDIATKKVKTIYHTDERKTQYRSEDLIDDNLIEYYDFIDVTNDKIYVLYRGEKYSEKSRDCIIKVFDWEGRLLNEYSISKKYDLSKFFTDEKNKILYGQSYTKDALYKFKL